MTVRPPSIQTRFWQRGWQAYWRLLFAILPRWAWQGVSWRKVLLALPKAEAPRALFERIPPLANESAWRALAEELGRAEQSYATYHRRPRLAASIGTLADPWVDHPPTGIILQGPLLADDQFTLETIRLYRAHYPADPVILSTWASEDAGGIDACRSAGAMVVLSEPPAQAGPSNINRQLVSTQAGLRQCRELGLMHALKTRTDQRFYNPNTLAYLHRLGSAFPLRSNVSQGQRLVGIQLNTLKFRRYGLSDMFLFGTTEDMIRYWGCPLDQRESIPDVPFGTNAELRPAEVYLETHFLESLGRKQVWTVHDSWLALAEHFCILDTHAIDLYWPKYQSQLEFRRLGYQYVTTGQELSFLDWLTFYLGVFAQSDLAEAASQMGWNTPMELAREGASAKV